MGPDWGGGRERRTKLGKVFFIREREKAVDWVGYLYFRMVGGNTYTLAIKIVT